MPTTKQVEIIDKQAFTKAALDENVKAFIVYINFLASAQYQYISLEKPR